MKNLLMIFLLLLCTCTSNTISENIESNTDTHGIIIPAYIYPNDSIYDKIIESSSKLHENLIVILNPNNGPDHSDGYAYNKYLEYISLIQVNNSKIAGYVSTYYGGRSVDEVKSDIDMWISDYSIDYIFLDETSAQASDYNYYAELETYIQNKGKKTINNFGITLNTEYKGLESIKIILEESAINVNSLINSVDYQNWTNDESTYNSNAVLIHTANSNYIETIDDYKAYWIYITDDVLENPWDSLPSYYEEFINKII